MPGAFLKIRNQGVEVLNSVAVFVIKSLRSFSRPRVNAFSSGVVISLR